MNHRYSFVLVLGTLAAGIASPQTVSSDLTKYLTLTDTQVQSINALNQAFSKYTNTQENQYFQLQSQAQTELAKDSPDPGVVGSLYAQAEMISRDYNTQLSQVQSQVAAVLTTGQVVQVSALLDMVRLQPLVSEAYCAYVEQDLVPNYAVVSDIRPAQGLQFFTSTSSCSVPPVPTALVNYLSLSDAQVSTIENTIRGNQDYLNRQALKIQELQYEIQDLTAAQTIDTVSLGADYVTIAQIQRDETTQTGSLPNTVRSVITDQQQPQLKALDNAAAMEGTAMSAVSNNILVLPPDLAQSNGCGSLGPFPIAVLNPFSGPVCVGVSGVRVPFPVNIIPTATAARPATVY